MAQAIKATDGSEFVLQVPEDVTFRQLDACRLVMYHGATTIKDEWATTVFAREEALRAATRQIQGAVAALGKYPGDHAAKLAANGLKAILARHDE